MASREKAKDDGHRLQTNFVSRSSDLAGRIVDE
jgi:hypothetical protein